MNKTYLSPWKTKNTSTFFQHSEGFTVVTIKRGGVYVVLETRDGINP